MKKQGFTLIELLVVIAVVAIIIAFAVPNFLGARQRANDTKKKAEIVQLKNALRLYYNDYNKYPQSSSFSCGSGKYNWIMGCGATADLCCPATCSVDFAAGGTGCDVLYMKKFPSDLGSSMYYWQVSSGDDFCLKVTLDNASDSDIAKSQSKCATACSGKVSGNDYAVCAD